MCLKNKLPDNCESYNFNRIKDITIQDDKYYINGQYWGNVIEKNDNYFKVKCMNGNKYMEGQIITVYFNIRYL